MEHPKPINRIEFVDGSYEEIDYYKIYSSGVIELFTVSGDRYKFLATRYEHDDVIYPSYIMSKLASRAMSNIFMKLIDGRWKEIYNMDYFQIYVGR